jgi:hypothetical protein
MIVLTLSEAEALMGREAEADGSFAPLVTHTVGAAEWAIQPFRLQDGSYVLPEDVLDDAAHADKKAALEVLPKRAMTANDWPANPRVQDAEGDAASQ